ncbi:MAG: hypothetical protein ACXW2E_01930 [Nitrososphaeraceae archaeon]
MKRLIVVLCTLLSACDLDGFSEAACLQAIQEEAKTTNVRVVPGFSYRYVVKKPDGSIWYYEIAGSRAEITSKTQLF